MFARPNSHPTDIAVDATLRAAAIDGSSRITDRYHLRGKVRRRRDRHTVIFVLDASDSMTEGNQLQVARIAIFALLASAERRRDRVALVTFSDQHARVALEPTSAVIRARRAVESVELGGATPLAAGLSAALNLVETTRSRDPGEPVEVMVFSDGEGNVSPQSRQEQIETVAERASRLGIHPLFVDTTGTRRGSEEMRVLAETFGGVYRRLHGADRDEMAEMLTELRSIRSP